MNFIFLNDPEVSDEKSFEIMKLEIGKIDVKC